MCACVWPVTLAVSDGNLSNLMRMYVTVTCVRDREVPMYVFNYGNGSSF